MHKERKSCRLSNYDYSSEGIYYVTLCTKDRSLFFGRILDSKISYSEIGLIAQQYWLEIPIHFKHVKLDDFIVMPNHIHGILNLDYSKVGTHHGMAPQPNQFSRPVKNSVSVIINQYKSSVKRWCNKNGFECFNWQPRFYDNIVRNDDSLDRIREYINYNILNWEDDDLFHLDSDNSRE